MNDNPPFMNDNSNVAHPKSKSHVHVKWAHLLERWKKKKKKQKRKAIEESTPFNDTNCITSVKSKNVAVSHVVFQGTFLLFFHFTSLCGSRLPPMSLSLYYFM